MPVTILHDIEYSAPYGILSGEVPDLPKPVFQICLACSPSFSFSPNSPWAHQLAQIAIRKAIEGPLGSFYVIPEEPSAYTGVINDHVSSTNLDQLEKGGSIDFGPVVASAQTFYERIVEWIVPDTRGPNGRHIGDYRYRQDPDKYKDSAWDAVRFRNPFKFPMTTGPAMVVSGGRFNGQNMSYWVNPGEETTLHITKALSVRTRSVEHEEKGERRIVYVGGNDYRKGIVKGQLTISNHRKEKISLVLRRRFSGKLLSADGEPECVLREEGVWSVNERNELTWKFTLKPGEKRDLAYRYEVLVDN